jgi:hypothetical protein
VAQRIIEQADMAGANNVQIGFNRGAMPHDMFMNQIRRFAADVLPRLQAHIPSGWKQPDGMCLLHQPSPVGAFPIEGNRNPSSRPPQL